MLSSPAADTHARRPRPAYSTYEVSVARVQRLSRSFLRITFTGKELETFGTTGLDQRVKIVLPLPGLGVETFPRGTDWYRQWRELPAAARNPIRTYTVRGIRPAERELDIDFVLHGASGPASRWAENARVGDELAVVGPDRRGDDPLSGVEWRPGEAHTVLLAGDETAAPAICSILASLPADARGRAIIEVPDVADVLDTPAPDGVAVAWLPRAQLGAERGRALTEAVREWARRHVPERVDAGHAGLGPVDSEPAALTAPDTDILWEIPQAPDHADGLYAWLAGESGVIKALRRLLVSESGLDRRQVAFMGYWRAGRAELN